MPDPAAPLAVICAMAEEKTALKEFMSGIVTRDLLGRTVTLGTLDGRDVVVAESGVGKVAASVTAALLAREFGCRGLVVSGVAGGLDPELHIGDTIIAHSLVQHDYGHLQDAALTPFRPGVPPLGEHRRDISFDLDPSLAARLRQVAAEITLPDLPADILPPDSPSAHKRPPGLARRVLMGRILSGDQFINSEMARQRLHRDFSAHAVEMEGAAVAQVGALLGLPVVVVRCLSDLAGSESHLDFPRFVTAVAPGAAMVLRRLIREL